MNKEKLVKIGVVVAIFIVLFIAYKKVNELIEAKKGFPQNNSKQNFITKLMGNNNENNNTVPDPYEPAQKDELVNVKMIVYAKETANIRSSAEVNNGKLNNLIAENLTGELGEVISKLEGTDGYDWYKIKLKEPIERFLFSEIKEGYVRSDVVTTKQ